MFVSYANNGMKCTGDKSTRGYILFRAYKGIYIYLQTNSVVP